MGCAASQAVGVVEIGQTKGKEKNFYYNDGKVKHGSSNALVPLNLKGINNEKVNVFGDNTSIFSNDSGYTDDYHKRISSGEKSGKSSASHSRPNLDRLSAEKRNNANRSEFPPINNTNYNTTSNSSLKGLPPLNFNNKSSKLKNSSPRDNNAEPNDLLKLTGLVQKKENYAKFELVEEKLMSRNLSMLTLKSNMDVAATSGTSSGNNHHYHHHQQHQQQQQSQQSVPQPKGPPLRLLLQREKTKPLLTADQIEEKLEKANQRKQEQLKLRGSISIADKRPESKYDFIKKDLRKQQSDDDEEFNKDVIERQKRLREMRDKIKAKNNSESIKHKNPSPRVQLSAKEMEVELEKFRPKTPANFKPVYS